MDIRLIKDALSKAKLYGTRGDYIGSLKLMLQGLREVVSSPGTPPAEVRSFIREVAQIFAYEESVQSLSYTSLLYNPGEEKALYMLLKKVYDILRENADAEAYSEALGRKKKIDKYLILGKKLLAENKIAEADQAFQESVKYYKDEADLFPYIAKMLLDANQAPRALIYLKKAASLDRDNQNIAQMIQSALSQRDQA